MQKLSILLLIACLSAEAQTLRLRVGGPDSGYRVIAITNGTPAEISVVKILDPAIASHNLVNGDTIYIHDVYGCTTANGYRKVTNVDQAAGKFRITDVDGNNITCDYPFDNTYKVGFLGKVNTFTVASNSPRVMFPQSGPTLARNMDPDGAPTGSCTGPASSTPNTGGTGCAVAPVAVENDIAWRGMIALVTPKITSNGTCDGVTASLCPAEESLVNSSTPGREAYVQNAAQIWFADRSKRSYLNAARYWINNIERGIVLRLPGTETPIPNFATDDKSQSGGLGSGNDYLTTNMTTTAMSYDLIRSDLTPAERTAFANKMLNDHRDNCVNSLQPQQGTVSTTSNSSVITGSGLSVYSPGDLIAIRYIANYGSSYPAYGSIVSVADDTSATVQWLWPAQTSPGNYSGKDHLLVNKTWSPNTCGAWYISETHSGGRSSPNVATGYFQLGATINATQTTLQLGSPGYSTLKHLSLPFYAHLASELVKVTAITPSTLTVVRGWLGTPAVSHGAGMYGVEQRSTGDFYGIISSVNGVQGLMGDYRHNLTFSKYGGFLSTLQVLVGDDSRAVTRYEQQFNYFYDLMYSYAASLQTGATLGGVGTNWYGFQRFNAYLLPPVLGSRNLTTTPNDFGTEFLWKILTAPYMITTPKGDRNPIGAPGAYQVQQATLMAAVSPMLHPGVDSARANYWLKQKTGMHVLSSYSNTYRGIYSWLTAAFNPVDSPQSDYKDTNLWNFFNDPELGGDGNSLFVSKSGWTAADSSIFSWVPYHPYDHVVDTGSGVAGSFSLWKGEHLLLGMDPANGLGSGFSNETLYTNTMDIGGSGNLRSLSPVAWVTPLRGAVLRNATGNSTYVYGLVNATEQYKPTANVIGSYRHNLHWKPVDGTEYWITFDDHRTATPTLFTARQFYHRKTDSAALFSDLSPNGDFTSILFRQPTPINNASDTASVRTAILYPDGAGSTVNATSGISPNGNTRVSYAWPFANTAEQIAVHMIGQDTTSPMPPVQLLPFVDPNFRGFEINESARAKTFLFGRNGAQYSSLTFTTTLTPAGKILIAGLAAAQYTVLRNGLPFLTNQAVASDGTLLIDSPASTLPLTVWSLLQTGSNLPTLAVNRTSATFAYSIGATVPPSQTFIASCIGGPCSTTATATCSWISLSPGSGTTPVTYSINVNPTNLPAGTYSCDVVTSAPATLGSPIAIPVVLTVTDPAAPLQIVTATLPWAIVGTPYYKTLDLLGGTPPYVWSVANGTLPAGLSLSTSGVISGTPTRQEITNFTVLLTDSGSPAQTATASYLLAVDPNGNQGAFSISPSAASASQIAVRYGNKAMDAGQSCTLSLSLNPSFSPLVESYSDTGGPSRRSYVFGMSSSLQAGTDYFLKAVCSSNLASMTVSTPGAGSGNNSINVSFKPPTSLGVQSVAVSYGPTTTLGSTITQACSPTCVVAVPGAASTTLYLRHSYLNSLGQEVAKSTIRTALVN